MYRKTNKHSERLCNSRAKYSCWTDYKNALV